MASTSPDNDVPADDMLGDELRSAPGRQTSTAFIIANASAASVPGTGLEEQDRASLAVACAIGSMTIFTALVSGSQWVWACGADADGFAPQTRMQAASLRRSRIKTGQRIAKEHI